MEGGITKAEMGLGGEVQVTVATAATVVGAGAEPSQTGREGRDRWEGYRVSFHIAKESKESWVVIMAGWEIYGFGGT